MPATTSDAGRSSRLRDLLGRNRAVLLFYLAAGLLILYPMLLGRLVAPGDARVYYYPFKVYYGSLVSRGFPVWMPYQFAGISYPGSSESGVLYPPNLPFLVSGSGHLYNLLLLLHYAAAAFFTHLYLRLICRGRLPAFCGGMAFGLAGFVMAHKGHLNIVNAAVWLPLLLYLYERIRREGRVSFSLLAALAVAAQVFAGHYQISLYTYLVLGLFVLFYGVGAERGTRGRFVLLTALPLALGLALALPQLLATWEVSRVASGTGNGYAFFTGYSFSPWLFLQFLYPFFFSSDYGRAFWGPGNLAETSCFVGTAVLVLAGAALLRYRRRDAQVRFWSWVGLLALFLALGGYNPLYRLTWYVPVYNLFRIPSRHLLELDLALAVLGSLGLNYVLREKERSRRLLLGGAGAVLALGLFMALAAGPLYRLLVPERGNAFRQGLEHALRWDNPAVLVPLACAAGYLAVCLLWYRGRRAARWAGAALVAVVALELFSFSAFIDNESYSIAGLPGEASASWRGALEGTAGEARVLYTGTYPYAMDPVNRDIAMLNGYESLIIDDFAYLTGLGLAQDAVGWRNLLADNVTLSAANCGYVVVEKGKEELGLEGIEVAAAASGPGFEEVALGDDWEGSGFTVRQGEARLAAGAGSVAVISQDFPAYEGSRYLVSYTARADEGFSGGLSVRIDLNGRGGPSGEIELKVDAFSPDGLRHMDVIDVCRQPPSDPPSSPEATISFSTGSPSPIFIQNVNITYLDGIPLPPFEGSLTDRGPPEDGNPYAVYEMFYGDDRVNVYRNLNCLPRAWAVRELRVVEDLAEMKGRSFRREYDPSVTALVFPDVLEQVGAAAFAAGSVEPQRISEDYLSFEVEMEGDGFLVDSDQCYRGWTAWVDGSEVPVHRVNGFMRGVQVPEGAHRVEFRYSAPALRASLWACPALFLLALAALGWLLFSERGRRIDKGGIGVRPLFSLFTILQMTKR